jgi:exopolysaccharide biosynthesis WecB/TagA/CpsF family protein
VIRPNPGQIEVGSASHEIFTVCRESGLLLLNPRPMYSTTAHSKFAESTLTLASEVEPIGFGLCAVTATRTRISLAPSRARVNPAPAAMRDSAQASSVEFEEGAPWNPDELDQRGPRSIVASASPQLVHSTFLGISFANSHVHAAADLVLRAITGLHEPITLIHANLNTVYHARRAKDSIDADINKAVSHRSAIVFFEGIALKLARKLASGTWFDDINGTDLVPIVFAGATQQFRVALIGGDAGVAQAAGVRLGQQFPNAVIVGTWNGFNDLDSYEDIVQHLLYSKPHLVLVGLGTPLQEPLAVRLTEDVGAPATWAVGGLLDLWSGRRRRAPSWVLAARCEWLWRLLAAPHRYWKRTLIQGPWLLTTTLLQARRGRSHSPAPKAYQVATGDPPVG